MIRQTVGPSERNTGCIDANVSEAGRGWRRANVNQALDRRIDSGPGFRKKHITTAEILAFWDRFIAGWGTPSTLTLTDLAPSLASDDAMRRWIPSYERASASPLLIGRWVHGALGLDAGGKTLFYAVGEWITPKELAESMAAAGAVNAAEADINWSYTRFLFFGRPQAGAPLQVISTLIPKMKYGAQGYVAKASERDFFYLKRRR